MGKLKDWMVLALEVTEKLKKAKIKETDLKEVEKVMKKEGYDKNVIEGVLDILELGEGE